MSKPETHTHASCEKCRELEREIARLRADVNTLFKDAETRLETAAGLDGYAVELPLHRLKRARLPKKKP
jgi:hypothetical protein